MVSYCVDLMSVYSITFSKHVLLRSIKFFRKAIFWRNLMIQKSNTLYCILFPERCLFWVVTFSKDATCYSIYLFRRTPFLQDTFSEELIFHTDLFVKWALVNVQFKFESSFLCIYYCSKSHHRCLNKVSWLNNVHWSCYFLMKLLFE